MTETATEEPLDIAPPELVMTDRPSEEGVRMDRLVLLFGVVIR